MGASLPKIGGMIMIAAVVATGVVILVKDLPNINEGWCGMVTLGAIGAGIWAATRDST